ncbi:MAG TPA: alpha-glucan family phosphorylase [Steroidobacteraceae bacterium]|nr:alpha-glucan family phosphorylase [Steroidobacteraceae bacterium]
MRLVEISPVIPPALERLNELAGNLSYSWHRPTRALFEDLDQNLWRETHANPRLMLRCVSQAALDAAAGDPAYLARYHEALANYDRYQSQHTDGTRALVAYFCAEYGFHESFPIYSGGLGILAGDHCKAASDEQLAFVAVGLAYRQGYFSQTVDSDGTQHAGFSDVDPRDLPLEAVRDGEGRWLVVHVPIADRQVLARVWRAEVGHVSVFLLDTNVEANSSADRDITFRLYGGDEAHRIKQEMVLGIGGLRALRALGLNPAVWHMNEGHAAFLALELLRERLAAGMEFDAALEAVAAQCVFTTHTPVAAGHDAFSDHLFVEHFSGLIPELGGDVQRLLALGRAPGAGGFFNMTRLALNGARRINGVSRIHGAVSSRLCADHWRDIPPAENPVGYVTNGVHVPTFLSSVWATFLDERLPGWRDRLCDVPFWQAVDGLSDAPFWNVAQDVKSRMLAGVRSRLEREYRRKGMGRLQLQQVTRLLDPANPDVLTIGFARRFATYKRAALLLRDRERLLKLVTNEERPVLFLFAGKAHPADHPGQQVLREIKRAMLQPELAGRVVFLEDYDIQLARWLVTGVDVWLNNPIAPLEASGTSGIKAAVNGRLNLSILDGWWAEAFDGGNGWGLPGADAMDDARRDDLDAASILDALEAEVVPLYYARNSEGLSPEWVRRCRHAMASVIPRFNMRRVVSDYAKGLYRPAAEMGQRLLADGGRPAAELAAWKRRVRERWEGVQILAVQEERRAAGAEAPLAMRARVQLAGLDPADLCVEFKARRLLPDGGFEMAPLCSFGHGTPPGHWLARFDAAGDVAGDGTVDYTVSASPPGMGQYQLEVRVYPWHPLLAHPLEMGLMKAL